MKNLAKSLLDNEEISAIVNVKHSDIFSVLGIHKHPMTSGLIVRAFLPEALSVEVIETKTEALVAELSKVDQAGLFEGKLGRKRNVFDYRLRVLYKNETVIVDDPYRYPSLLKSEDLYLFCEGTHEQA
jgi:1,4-alpha-glucan branching enzyme